MRRKVFKKVLAATLATTTIVGNMSVANAFDEKSVKTPVLVPTPKEISWQDKVLTITDSVNIKGQDVADPDAVRELSAYLTDNGITVNETEQEGATTIFIAEENDEVAGFDAARTELGLDDAADLKAEGYVLGIDGDDTILIEGKDGDGTFYGVKTLTQLASEEDGALKVQEVKVKDEPTMTTRGSIEGFYGTPWTHQDRLDQIKFYGDYKLNTYIYAPKDDVYHRERWRDPYPEAEMNKMKELVKTAKENKVDFVFSLSPGNDIKFTGATAESDYQALIHKCELMYDMGVRSYAIFFDDIQNKQGKEQAEFLNRVNREFIQEKGDITPLITVPTEYDSNAMSSGPVLNAYTKAFSETLDRSVKVLWTGPAVVPEGIDVANAEFVKSIYGESVGIWWNYPVTDYITNKLALGPVYGLDKGLADELDFLVLNPMEHADLSKISLATGADYAWNTAEYDYEQSFENAIDDIYGDLAPYMYTFANHSTRLVAGWASTGRADAPEVKALMTEVIKKLAKGEDASAETAALNAEFDNMILAADTLKQELTSAQLSHCNANLDKLKALGQADKIALNVFIAYSEDNQSEINSLKSTLQSRLSSLQSGKLVSELTALQFVKDALSYTPDAKAGFEVSNTFVVPGQKIQLTNTSSVASTELEWTFTGADIETSTEENPVISYSHEGVYTISLKAKNRLGEDELVKTGVITVSKEADGEMVNLSQGKTATASSYTASSESPDKAIDGIISTKWCDASYNKPHNITINLGAVKTVSNVIIYHAEEGGEGAGLNTRAYRIQVSVDGRTFTDVANVKGNTAGLTNDFIPVSLAQYVKLITDEPTQGGDSAARIYEIQVMGLDKAIELPEAFVPANKEAFNAKLEEAKAELAKTDVYDEAGLAQLQTVVEAAEAVKVDNGATQEMVDEALEHLQIAMDNLVKKIYTVTVNGEVKATGAYNTQVSVTAPVEDGKTFTGWLYNGKMISKAETYRFFISSDMELTPCYEEKAPEAAAFLTNVRLTKRTDQKADVQFVGQLVVPEGYKIKEAGLIWSTKTAAEVPLITEDNKLNPNLKATCIQKISTTNQFSVTIKGMPEGYTIRGRIFATLEGADGTELVYSEELKATNLK